MDDNYTPPPERVESFVIALATQLLVAGTGSHEGAIFKALMMLNDRIYRDFGSADIARLAEKMRDEAYEHSQAILMRAQIGLERDRYRRSITWGAAGTRW